MTEQPVPEGVVLSEVAQRAVGSVEVPGARFVMQPDPLNNEWGALPVGLPIWLHVGRLEPVEQVVVQDGISRSRPHWVAWEKRPGLIWNYLTVAGSFAPIT